MSAVDIRSREGASYLGIESTYGTAATSPPRIFTLGDVKMQLVQKEHEILDESVYVGDYKGTVKGLKSATARFHMYPKPATAQLIAAATPATPPHAQIIKAMFGGEAAAAGSLVTAASTTTTVNVTAGTGTGMPVGTLIAVQNAAGNLEVTRVTTTSANSVTVYPPLSGAPAVGNVVVNSYTYYITDTNTQSFTFQHAKAGSAAYQYQLLAGIADLEFGTDRDSLITLTAACRFSDWTDGTLGLSTAFAADTQGPPLATSIGFTLLQPTATVTRLQYPLHSLGGKFDLGMDFVTQYNGAVNATVGAMRVKGRPSAMASLLIRADRTVLDTYWANQTQLNLIFGSMSGSGTTSRGIVFDFPQAIIIGRPEEDMSTGRLLYKCNVSAQLATSAATDLARKGASVSLF